MKLIKALAFVLQFGLIGLAIAVLYLLVSSDRSRHEVVEFLAGEPGTSAEAPAAGTPAGRPAMVVSYADAVASSAASVVTIYTTKTVREKSNPLLDDPIFSRFFGDQLQRRQRSRSEISLGSGVIIGTEGYILTNQHVIDGADEILIALADGRGSAAVLIGEDKDTDLAVLQVRLDGMVGIRLGATAEPRVGDVVLAIGNPLNVGQTVTMGIISATGREQIGLNTLVESFIQTDAAINPGNSGGALVNAYGELIGINTAIFSQATGAQGIGFAIPVSLALDIMWQIIEHGKVTRGWIGVVVTEITAKAAMEAGRPGITGALITDVYMDSPAARAGVQPGDIVVAVDDKAVAGTRDLVDKITLRKPGERTRIKLYRGELDFDLEVEVAQRPQQ